MPTHYNLTYDTTESSRDENNDRPKQVCSRGVKIVVIVVVILLIAAAIAILLGVLLGKDTTEAEEDLPTSTEINPTTPSFPTSTENEPTTITDLPFSTETDTTTSDPNTVPDQTEHEFQPGCTVMIGVCTQKVCGKVDGTKMCSVVDKFERINKTCVGGKTHSVLSPSSCKCEECEDQIITKVIFGRVTWRNGNTTIAIANVSVSIDEVRVNETDIDGNYQFSYNITTFNDETTDVYLYLKPPQNSGLLPANKIVDLSGKALVIEKNAILQTVDTIIIFNPSEEQVVMLGGDETTAFANILIPKNSVTAQNGKLTTDNVTFTIGAMDTRVEGDIEYVPDTFYSTEENDTIYSKGMFNSQCKTSSGDDCEIKNVQVTLSLPLDEFPEVTDNMYMWLNKNGTWKKLQKMEFVNSTRSRRKRQANNNEAALAATLDLGNEIYNMDYFGIDYCYIKVRVFTSPSLTSPIHNARVNTTYQSNATWLAYKWNTGWYNDGSICAQVPCDSRGPITRTYLTAVNDDGETLIPVDINVPNFNATAYGIKRINKSYVIQYPDNLNDDEGLLNGKYDFWQCYHSDGAYLAFYRNPTSEELNYIPFVEKYLPYSGYVYDPLFWWQDKYWNNPCFLSIGIYTNDTTVESIRVDIESFGGNVESVAGQWIGTRRQNITLANTTTIDGVEYKYGFDIVEYKCSGNIHNSGNEIDQTLLKISLPGNCKMMKVNKNLQNQLLKDAGGDFSITVNGEEGNQFIINAPKMSNYDSMGNVGIFTNPNWGRNNNHWSFKYAHHTKLVAKESYKKDHEDYATYLTKIINETVKDDDANINSMYLSDFINETYLIKFIDTAIHTVTAFNYLKENNNHNVSLNLHVNETINKTFVLEYFNTVLFRNFIDKTWLEVYWDFNWLNGLSPWEYVIQYYGFNFYLNIYYYYKYNYAYFFLFDSTYFSEFLNGALLDNPYNLTDYDYVHAPYIPFNPFIDSDFNDFFINEGYLQAFVTGEKETEEIPETPNPFAFVFEC